MIFWSPQVHNIITVIHVFSTIFWLGWIVFIFFILRPVALLTPSVELKTLMPSIRKRVRKFVFWLIPIIILTGVYNMGYLGLLNGHMLVTTPTGHRMIWKLATVVVIFGIYYLAPYILGEKKRKQEKGTEGTSKSNRKAKRVNIILHLILLIA